MKRGMAAPTPFKQAIKTFLVDANAARRATKRTRKGLSKVLFDDTRTLDLLADGHTDITVSRLERGAQRLTKLLRDVPPTANSGRR